MAALTLVEVDFVLDLVDVFSLFAEDFLVFFALFLEFALLFVVFIHKDGLVSAVKLLLQLLLLFSELSDTVEVVSVLLDAFSQLALRLLKIAFSFFFLKIAALINLGKLCLQIQNYLRWTAHFQAVQVDEVAEPEHPPLVIVTLGCFQLFVLAMHLVLLCLAVIDNSLLILLQQEALLLQISLTV